MTSSFLVLLLSLALVCMGVMNMAGAEVRLEATDGGGFLCKAAAYEARVGADGRLQSIRAGGTEFLALPAAFVHKGQFVAFKAVKQAGPTTLMAEGEPKGPAKSVAGSPCPFNVRVGYEFKPDRIELTLEQSLDVYGAFAWVPSASVLASRDALTDCPIAPAGPSLYGQTDPRWTTRDGPVLRFDFGVWQRSFANANWAALKADGKDVRYMHNTAPAARAMKVSVYPLAQPSAKDALTFDISAANPDFLLPGGQPVHFDIRVTNAGPQPVEALVRFEVRDYLTQQPVAAKPTQVKLPSKGEVLLPTDLALQAPGPYRAAIVIEEAGKVTRSFWCLFTYDFQRYAPATTRAADFEQFWKDALAESAATPLDPKLTPVPDKSTAAVDAFKASFATLGGRRIYGWYARPKTPGRYPAHIRFPSSGVYPLAGPEAAPERCSLWIGIHGYDVDLSNMPAGDDIGKRYWTAGIESPKTSMWRIIYISLVRA
ncbi:MAG: acetylxylan esterase, partial [Planctomycetes bacterium]|nr:acetylxylan esterase [Planctomycetota bacterium]